jgi:hypothetical protein
VIEQASKTAAPRARPLARLPVPLARLPVPLARLPVPLARLRPGLWRIDLWRSDVIDAAGPKRGWRWSDGRAA